MMDRANFDPVLKDVQTRRKTVPLSNYFGGKGSEVMGKMKQKYGAKAEQVFHATANKMKKKHPSAFKAGMAHGKKDK